MKPHTPTDPAQRAAAEDNLFRAILTLESTTQCREFFKDLCTPAELQALADRWAVVEPLSRGEPYRRIHDQTGVSVTTIGRVARFLVDGNGGYERVLRKLNRDPA
jgi:TrpR-related protein YerC/YecD